MTRVSFTFNRLTNKPIMVHTELNKLTWEDDPTRFLFLHGYCLQKLSGMCSQNRQRTENWVKIPNDMGIGKNLCTVYIYSCVFVLCIHLIFTPHNPFWRNLTTQSARSATWRRRTRWKVREARVSPNFWYLYFYLYFYLYLYLYL